MARIEQEIIKNSSEWRSLLEKDLAGYPPEIVNEKKAELNTIFFEKEQDESRGTGEFHRRY